MYKYRGLKTPSDMKVTTCGAEIEGKRKLMMFRCDGFGTLLQSSFQVTFSLYDSVLYFLQEEPSWLRYLIQD